MTLWRQNYWYDISCHYDTAAPTPAFKAFCKSKTIVHDGYGYCFNCYLRFQNAVRRPHARWLENCNENAPRTYYQSGKVLALFGEEEIEQF